MYQQVLIILAGAFNYISPFIKDFKKQVGPISALYEQNLIKFSTEDETRQEFFYPFFQLLAFADKQCFNFETNPLIFILKSFEPSFYRTLNA